MHLKMHTIPFLVLYMGNNIDISKKKYYNKKRKYSSSSTPEILSNPRLKYNPPIQKALYLTIILL